MNTELEYMKDTVLETIKRSGGLFTGFGALLIVGVGITVIDNPSRWWIVLVAIVGLCLSVFLLVNARVVIKFILSIITVVVTAALAFQSGGLLDPLGPTNLLWMMTTLCLYSLNVSASYAKPTAQSRWGSITIASIVGFTFTYISLFFGLMPYPALGLNTAVTFGSFMLFYHLNRKTVYRSKFMPEMTFTEDFYQSFVNSVAAHGWGVSKLDKKGKRPGLLVWNDKHAFVVAPVKLSQSFGVGGRKADYLTHKAKNINPWLASLVNALRPKGNLSGADYLIVLLDDLNKNGHKVKTIGVQQPDTKRKYPISIYPSRGFIEKSSFVKLLENLEAEYGDSLHKLTKKQLNALDSRLPNNFGRDDETAEVLV